MAITKWDAGWVDRGNVLTTELNSLASDTYSAAGNEIANQTNLDKYGKAEIQVTFGTAPAAGGFLVLVMVTAPDGTNYEDGGGSVDPGAHRYVASVPVRVATTAQRLTTHIFDLEPAKTKFMILNRTNQTLPASGSIVKLYTQNDETV